MEIREEDLVHYGMPRRSGRYPWGSGGNEQYARNQDFLESVESMKKEGLDEKTIAKGIKMTIKELRARKSNAKAQIKAEDISYITRLRVKGMSPTEISKQTGHPEATVRSYLAPGAADKHDKTQTVANVLKAEVDEKGMIDVGGGVSNRIDITQTRFDNALALLKDQGYKVHPVKQKQVLSGHDTLMKVLVPPGVTQRDAFLSRDTVQQIGQIFVDNGGSHYGLQPAIIINPKRVDVVYADKGGKEADGVIYIRPDVEDVSLGGSLYAQVRVRVGDGYYLKGMAMYKQDLPDGVDLQFNTPKQDTGNKLDAFKPIETDIDGKVDDKNPFGAYISKQIGGELGGPITSSMNIVNEEGNWAKWSRTLSSQFLSKQSPKLAKQQLDMTYERSELEFDSIMKLTNATVRKKLLEDFAGATDTRAVHLKAAQLPRQAVHVLLPINDMKPTEIYAPKFDNGEEVVLIRHPHGGTFEIPRLKVNNNHPTAKAMIGHDKMDAVGIHNSVAERLSGADFDGDTVLVIPDKAGKIRDSAALPGLKNFDPVAAYPGVPGEKVMSNTQTEMGKISNLITDMSLKGANPDELARAVRHSMVVIDAEKKGLNHRLSAQDNNIAGLRKEYQAKDPITGKGGASTLISRKRSEKRIPDFKPRSMKDGGPVDKDTGELVFVPTNKIVLNKQGERVSKTRVVPALGDTNDAFTLVSPGRTRMEVLYATHSNKLKALANRARLEVIKTPRPKQVASAKKAYAKEVASLEASLDLANRNRPLERQAHVIANANIRLKKQANPNLKDDKDSLKKVSIQALEEARARVDASSKKIPISDREWDAIQAGAISNHKLEQILNYADDKVVRDHATPKTALLMTPTKTKRAQAMLDLGYTRNQIAHQLGVSLTTLDTAIKG